MFSLAHVYLADIKIAMSQALVSLSVANNELVNSFVSQLLKIR